MRILYSHRIHSRDGQSVHLDELVRALRAADNDVRVAERRLYERAAFGSEGRLVPALRRLVPTALQEIMELAYKLPAAIKAMRACRGWAPDVIYERYNLYFF